MILSEVASRFYLLGDIHKAIDILSAIRESMDKFYIDEEENQTLIRNCCITFRVTKERSVNAMMSWNYVRQQSEWQSSITIC